MKKKTKTPKPISQRKYLKRFGHCPFCDSENINGESVQVDGNTAGQEVSCTDCNAVWMDSYKLVGFDVMQLPQPSE